MHFIVLDVCGKKLLGIRKRRAECVFGVSRVWVVGVYSQPPHERGALELRTSLFLSEHTKLDALGAHRDRRHLLRKETNRSSPARCWLVCLRSPVLCQWGDYALATECSSQRWGNKVFLLCSALQWLPEILRTGLGVEFLLSRSSTLNFFPLPLSLLLLFFSQRHTLSSPYPS